MTTRGMSVDELRAFVMTLDGMEERSHHGRPDFRFRGKIVVNLDESDESITLKLPLDDQAALLARNEAGFSLPGGWAKRGWTTISLRDVDTDEIRELIVEAHQRSAP